MTRPIPVAWTCGLHTHDLESEALACITRRTVSSPLGWCPVPGCGKRGMSRDVVHEGYDLCDESYDRCEAGHTYPSKDAIPGDVR